MVFSVEDDKKTIDCLIVRIKNKMINPRNGKPFKLEDIKIEEIKNKVGEALASQ